MVENKSILNFKFVFMDNGIINTYVGCWLVDLLLCRFCVNSFIFSCVDVVNCIQNILRFYFFIRDMIKVVYILIYFLIYFLVLFDFFFDDF